MKEKTLALTITIILAIIGLILGLFASTLFVSIYNGVLKIPSSYNEFNFYKSQLEINGAEVKETLYFHTDKSYHTLFRTFQSDIATKNDNSVKNSIKISKVICNSGIPYFKFNNNCYKNPDFIIPSPCDMYTENNEYGCTFGNNLGFYQNKDYTISSDFILNPENLFKINNNYYIKFIAYGRNNHISLTKNQNLFMTGTYISINDYKSSEYVIIYIPFKGNINDYKIIEKPDFEYDTPDNSSQDNSLKLLISVLIIIGITLVHLLPAILFFSSWFFFGKELSDEDNIPEQLSQIPMQRKPWEVAAFFNPPFASIDKNFFSAMILDFSRRKIIEIKLTKAFFNDELLIKLNKEKFSLLDDIEKEFYLILEKLESYCKDKDKVGEFFNINKASKTLGASFNMKYAYLSYQKTLKEESKKYLEKTGVTFFTVSIMILMFISFFSGLYFLAIISLIMGSIVIAKTSLLTKYKGNFYKEYLEWQSFKKWLKGSPSMKETGHKGVILWEEYLVYATALGVSKQVLKELKQEGLISEKQFNSYSSISVASMSFAASSGGGSHGGGFSGGGGGGVGGGGGGGR